MRFTILNALIATATTATTVTAQTTTTTPPSTTWNPLPACLNLRDIMQSLNTTAVVTNVFSTVCDNAPPIYTTDYATLLRPFAANAITTETQNMGAPQLAASYMQLLDSLFELAQARCGLGEIPGGDGDLCSDRDYLEGVGRCVQANGWELVVRNAVALLPMLSARSCALQAAFFGSERLLEVVVPAYAVEFAAGR
ncbi:hypothetical protein BJX99DRAFT_36117 [Aspergillus californicus]